MEAGTQWVDNPNPPPVQDMAGSPGRRLFGVQAVSGFVMFGSMGF